MLPTQSLPVRGGLWKDICQLNIKEPQIRDKVVSGLAMEVGNGRKTRFWKDNWVQDGALKVIQSETLSDEITSYSFTSSLWKGFVPPKIELFGWFVLVGRVNTKERLIKLGVNIQSDTTCVLCTKEIKSAEHLFLQCEVTWQVWCNCVRSFRREWVIPGTVKDLFESWRDMHNRQQGQKVWMTAFFAVIWNIWLKRNAQIFNNTRASIEMMKWYAKNNLFVENELKNNEFLDLP
ncbi:uncharacterized protein [Arachis hypogaea]|uniref:uncharacterized protein n=1 Tax=Arachis hypogaea TaxID=3818 RepID=UPI003B21FEFF